MARTRQLGTRSPDQGRFLIDAQWRDKTNSLLVAERRRAEVRQNGGSNEGTVQVRVPYIVNTKQVEADTELILKWQVLVKEKPKQKEKTWVSDVKRAEAKRAKFTR